MEVAARGIDQPDRYAIHLVAVYGKEVAERRELRKVFARTVLPGPGKERLGHNLVSGFVGMRAELHAEQTNPPALLQLRQTLHEPRIGMHRPPHVGLPAQDPHVANKNILENHAVLAGDGHIKRAAMRHRFQRHTPGAVFCLGLDGLTIERDGDKFAFVRRSLNRHVLVSLNGHPIGEQAIWNNGGLNRGGS